VCIVSVRITGKVVRFTEQGDLVTDIPVTQLQDAPRTDKVRVWCDPHETFGLYEEDHHEPHATFLAVLASDGFLQLRVVGMSARELLGIDLGQPVVVEW
jgi:S-adenosylmethionine hydrolase